MSAMSVGLGMWARLAALESPVDEADRRARTHALRGALREGVSAPARVPKHCGHARRDWEVRLILRELNAVLTPPTRPRAEIPCGAARTDRRRRASAAFDSNRKGTFVTITQLAHGKEFDLSST